MLEKKSILNRHPVQPTYKKTIRLGGAWKTFDAKSLHPAKKLFIWLNFYFSSRPAAGSVFFFSSQSKSHWFAFSTGIDCWRLLTVAFLWVTFVCTRTKGTKNRLVKNATPARRTIAEKVGQGKFAARWKVVCMEISPTDGRGVDPGIMTIMVKLI